MHLEYWDNWIFTLERFDRGIIFLNGIEDIGFLSLLVTVCRQPSN